MVKEKSGTVLPTERTRGLGV